MNPDLVEAVARAVEVELDRDFSAWLERWCSPAGAYEDAPPPPSRYKTSPEKIAKAALKAHEEWLAEQGLVVVPKEPTECMVAGAVWALDGRGEDQAAADGIRAWRHMVKTWNNEKQPPETPHSPAESEMGGRFDGCR